ncbi:MAG: hypothetical protein WDN28_33840 [Chthoniobacter sp.]
MPRRTHALKNAAASERFQRTLARELWALGGAQGKAGARLGHRRASLWIDQPPAALLGMRRVRAYARNRTK